MCLKSSYYLNSKTCFSITLLVCVHAAAAAKLLQSCPTLYNPIDGSLLGSSAPGILQERMLEWVAISFFNACKWKVKVKLLSHVWLFTTTWTAAYQSPLSMKVSRQEYWRGLPLPSPKCSTSHWLKTEPLLVFLLTFINSVLTLWWECFPSFSLIKSIRTLYTKILYAERIVCSTLDFLKNNTICKVGDKVCTEGRKRSDTVKFLEKREVV